MNKEKEQHQHVSIATCVKVWVGIVALVALSYIVFLMNIEPLWLKRVIFTVIALVQGALGVAYFMQLRAERPSLVYAVVVPVSLLIGLIVFGIGEGDYVFGLRQDKQWVTSEKPDKNHENGGNGGKEEPVDLVEKGGNLAAAKGCLGCHTANGKPGAGPTWKGLYGSQREFADGSTALADDAFIKNAIVNPKADIAKKFPDAMPDMFKNLTEEELNAIVAYIKSLSSEEKK